MALEIYYENVKLAEVEPDSLHSELSSITSLVTSLTGVPECDLYALQNGRRLTGRALGVAPVRLHARLSGGKGGFGSMLRAIGAQIEKTTNREACRDLSGRRLRDIREEQRLRGWAAARPEREREAQRRKEERLQRLCAVPSHEFSDPKYEEARRGLEEAGGAALEAGNRAPAAPAPARSARKRPNLWIDEDLSDLSSGESGCEDEEPPAAKQSASGAGVIGKGKGAGKRSRPAPNSSPITVSDSGNESDIKPTT